MTTPGPAAPVLAEAAAWTQVARSLTGREDLQVLVDESSTARTDGKTIYVGRAHAEEASQGTPEHRAMAGLVIHEASHVLWTGFKRFQAWIVGKRSPKLAHLIYNLLEDPRAETLMVGLHPLAEAYLRAAHAKLRKFPRRETVSPKGRSIDPASKLLMAWQRRLYAGRGTHGLGRLRHLYKAGLEALPPAYWYACEQKEAEERAGVLYRLAESVLVSDEGAQEVDTRNWAGAEDDPVAGGKLAKGVLAGLDGKGRMAGRKGGGKASARNEAAGDGTEGATSSGNLHSDGAGDGEAIRLDGFTQPNLDSKDPLEWVVTKASNGSRFTHGDYPTVLMRSEPNAAVYADLLAELRPQISAMARELEERLNFEDGLEGRFESGSRVNRRALPLAPVRREIFDRRLTRRTAGDVAVVILLDQSGSMSGIMGSVQRAAVVLHEALARLGIEHGLYGHTVDEGKCVILEHVRPGSPRTDSFRLGSLAAMSGNRDGTAVRLMGRYLRAMPQQEKLMLVVNDGLPSDYEAGEDGLGDTRLAVEEASRYSRVVGIWLGSDEPEEQFKAIYPLHVGVADLRQLDGRLGKQLELICGLSA